MTQRILLDRHVRRILRQHSRKKYGFAVYGDGLIAYINHNFENVRAIAEPDEYELCHQYHLHFDTEEDKLKFMMEYL